MKEKIKRIIYMIIVFIILLVVIIAGIHIYFYPNIVIPKSSIKGNIWLLFRNNVGYDITEIERIIWSNGEKAIPELEKCVDKYTKNGQIENANECQGIIDWINENPPRKVD